MIPELAYADKVACQQRQAAGLLVEKELTILENIDRLIRQHEIQIDELAAIKEKLQEPNGFLNLTHAQLALIMQRY